MHVRREPAILYFGTPVVLISTLNEDGSANLAPMSSAFWLGWRCMLGLNRSSKTAQNLMRERECVLNLPSEREVDHVDALALTTGMNPVPNVKRERGYAYVYAKFARAGLTAVDSEVVRPPRVVECPVQLEATLEQTHGFADSDPALSWSTTDVRGQGRTRSSRRIDPARRPSPSRRSGQVAPADDELSAVLRVQRL
jgi:flavin reductase (DIM6/NTAB) family NADH-FMN oxidoreductase RutF